MPKGKGAVDQLKGVMNMGREAEESMGEAIHLSVLVDPTCPAWLARAVKDALMPERDALVDVSALSLSPVVVGYDMGVVLCGSSEDLIRGAIRTFCGARQHVVIVAESALDVPETYMPAKLGTYASTVVASEHGPLLERLAAHMLDSTEKDVSMAANFGFCREAATARLVSRCAARNAVMGLADFIPGAGMPLMTMNQINLGFDIAATYGRGFSPARLPEVIFIIAAGLTYRGAARVLLSGMPRLSLLIRIGLAYGGTLVTGRMLATHFKEGLPSPEDLFEDAF